MDEKPSTRAVTTALVLSILSWLLIVGTHPSRSRSFGDAVYWEPVTVLGPLVLPLFGIASGHVGLHRTRTGAKGRGRAATALVLGYLSLAFGVARLVGIATAH
ncbi:DUF4190 domain-containing protein [Amycolatopsis circi]|uniref:DUF4190 domain-containing protein n=1 Tax=Amycolatopsis circi TaxID=871959 RepID=UPI000E275B4F|nr:DUF4190 domain-containing protein [Amycolatopsis circi]